ncbi:MAG: ATP-binding protein [Bacteroidales bacterium]|nr:ATP-binding protein [Bacteroidales bacterium]
MLARKIDAQMDAIYDNSKMALMLTGARQVGKTNAFRRLAKRKFEHYIEINFIENADAKQIFKDVQSAKDILLRLTAFTSETLVPSKTLILFDEVQRCPECVTKIKFLVDEGSYRYGLTGSLLGVELENLRETVGHMDNGSSEPVGYMDIKTMYPLDFEEFALAVGAAPSLLEHLKECFERTKSVDLVVHEQMKRIFRLYLIVGGMPAPVWKYVQTNNIQSVSIEQLAILNLYKKDISQYDSEKKLYLDEIFDLIPSELNAKNKRFILKELNKNLKFQRYENSFLWMKEAGVAIPVYNVDEPRIPLLLNKQRNLFKLFQNDVGLLAYQYANGIQLRILSGEVNINFGAVYENVVAQELLAQGFGQIYYFNSKKQGEVDFIVEAGDGTVLPIEVKSGKNYDYHHALANILNNREYGLDKAVILCNENISVDGKKIYLPIYMATFIRKKQEIPGEYRLAL